MMERLASTESASAFDRYVDSLVSAIGHADRVGALRDYCLGLLMREIARASSDGGGNGARLGGGDEATAMFAFVAPVVGRRYPPPSARRSCDLPASQAQAVV